MLREARMARELSLADVESATRIRQKYLEALETGDFAKLPRGAVARRFLRTYAAFLGLDAEDMLLRYGSESGDAGDDVAIAEPANRGWWMTGRWKSVSVSRCPPHAGGPGSRPAWW